MKKDYSFEGKEIISENYERKFFFRGAINAPYIYKTVNGRDRYYIYDELPNEYMVDIEATSSDEFEVVETTTINGKTTIKALEVSVDITLEEGDDGYEEPVIEEG